MAVIGRQPAPRSTVVAAPQQHEAVWDDRGASRDLARTDAHAVPVVSNTRNIATRCQIVGDVDAVK